MELTLGLFIATIMGMPLLLNSLQQTYVQANLKSISNSKFFNLLMNGNTDCGKLNVDEELFLVLYFDSHPLHGSEDGMVH